MRTLGLYLWKEWREFRSIAIGVLLAVPLLLGIAGVLIPEKSFADPMVGSGLALMGGLVALAITLFALTTDLFAGEVRRGRLAFLDRVPAGLRAPFLAKALVFLIGTTAAFLYGFEIASIVVGWRGGSAPISDFLLHRNYRPEPGMVVRPQVIYGALFVWVVFPVACMAPRGVLTLPLAALILGGMIAGFGGALAYVGVSPRLAEQSLLSVGMQASLFAIVFVAAYVAFVRGYRASGGWPRAMRAGIPLLLLAAIVPLAPSARAAMVVAGWVDGESRVLTAYLSEDGKYAYLVRFSKVSENKHVGLRARRVDLRTGNAVELDGKSILPPVRGWMAHQPVRWPYLRIEDELIETNSGRAAEVDEATALVVSERAATPCRTAAASLPMLGYPSGFGVLSSGRGVFDPTRGRYFVTKAREVLVRPGRWLAKQRAGQGPMRLYDPETGEWSDALGIDAKDGVASVHDDGRVFVFRPGGPLVLVDPETGARELVRNSDGEVVEPSSFRDASRWGRCASRTPGGSRLFLLDGVPARYDEESSRLVCARVRMQEPMLLIGCADDDVVYVLVGERRIERLELGAANHRTIYSEE